LSFALERIGPLAAIVITVFYLLVLYLLALPNTPENLFASIYSESLIKTTCQHLLLLVGFDTLIYRKYYDTPPILVGHQLLPSEVLVAHPMKGKKKGKKFFVYAGHNEERQDKKQVFLSLYPKFGDYSLRGYSHRECW
jgi:hypothetical protein